MVRWIVAICLVMNVFDVAAQKIDAADLDAAARSAQGRSMLFIGQEQNEAMFDDAQERARYEEEMYRRAAYEEEMRRRAAYEEEMRRAEEERLKALRPVNLFGRSLKIYAEVNGEIITSRDMQDRVNIFVATTQIPVNAETKSMIMEKVLQSAIDEKIKLQEAKHNGIEISPAELERGMIDFAKSNGVSVSQLRQMLRQAQVSEEVFKSQMKAEMAWMRLVQRKGAMEAQVSQGQVDAALKSVTKDINTEKYLVSEIIIPKRKAAHIQELVDNLRQDPRFNLYAMQFSESPSSRNGGRLGWINKGQLPEPLDKALAKMKEGGISNPILVGSDYYILLLEKIYRPGIDKAPLPTEKEIRLMLENKKFEEFANKYLRDLRNKAIVDRRA